MPALWPIAIPGIAALGGVVVGKWLDVAGERRRWTRDQQAHCYAGFTAASEVLMAELSQEPHEALRRRCLDAFSGFAHAAAEVDVFGDLQAARAAHDLWNLINELLDDWDALLAKDDASWDADTLKYRVLLDSFTEAVRQSMGQDSLSAMARPAGSTGTEAT